MKPSLGLLLSTTLLTGVAARAAERPNVIFLFADDQRADTIGAHGNPHIDTPNLDKLAHSGVSFRQNYCPGSFGGAVCIASRLMLMTGRYWMNTKGWNSIKTFPQVMGENGYTTFAVGKWHNRLPLLKRSFQSGKSIHMGGMADHTKTSLEDLTHKGTLVNPRVGKEFSSTGFANTAIDFLKTHKKDKPFFLYVAFTAPHDPRNPPMTYRKRYYDKRPPLPKNFMPLHPFNNGYILGKKRDESLAGWPREKAVVSDQLCEYYGLITQLDEQVGRIVKQLKESDFADNTIIIYTADHGLGIGSHGLMGKQNIYEHSLGCPLIISGPGIPKNKEIKAMTMLTDLFPTICNLTKTPLPKKKVDGKDLASLWEGRVKRLHDSTFFPFQNSMRAVNDGRWKLHVYPKINHTLLFDLENDPDELNNLAEKNPEKVKALLKQMKKWQVRLKDKALLTCENPIPKEIDLTKNKRTMDVWQPKWIRDKYFDGRAKADHGPKGHKTKK